ncbi:MAG: metal ABC transporter permease [Austwickia sp.]|jgi:zinc transport system permease protein|nr:metal ABC transporter permease [Austwickia sp.]MBK8435534.1 metal ABC transporter permease [Austwickia sp.]MBK9100894.1 metal ABC transporter permease [Austwickia sp.]
MWPEILQFDFMRRALLAAVLIGAAAPTVGIFLVQRRLSLIGDGMGHVALAGVAIGVATGWAPTAVALAFALTAAVGIELLRHRGRTAGDSALAIVFYGGIAVGVVTLSKAPGAAVSLPGFLFGAITTTSEADLWALTALLVPTVALVAALRVRLFAVADDPEWSAAAGMPVLRYNILLAVLTSITVVVAMRVVGLLLVSALMIVPNATSQVVARSFRAALGGAIVIGVFCSVGGVVGSFYLATPSGATIVVLAVAVFGLVWAGATLARVAGAAMTLQVPATPSADHR